jgi:hypothetical protein
MIIPELRPTLRPETIPSDKDYERLDRALGGLLKEDQWVDDFIKQLNYTIQDIASKKWSKAASVGGLFISPSFSP